MQRRTLLVAALLVGSVATWAAVTKPQAGAGTMGMGSLDYLGIWAAMTAAICS